MLSFVPFVFIYSLISYSSIVILFPFICLLFSMLNTVVVNCSFHCLLDAIQFRTGSMGGDGGISHLLPWSANSQWGGCRRATKILMFNF